MTRDEFLAERRTGIGGADIAALFDLPPYGCSRKLWNQKRGSQTDFEVDVTPAMERGTMLEPLIADLYAKRTGRAVVEVGVARDPERPHLIVHCDRVISKDRYDRDNWADILRDNRGFGSNPTIHIGALLPDAEIQRRAYDLGLCGPWGVLEIKTCNREMFHRFKADGLPGDYILQVQHAMGVTGMTWGSFAVFWPDGWKMLPFDFERNDNLIATIRTKADDFWRMVENGPAPYPLPPSDERCDGCEYRRSCHGETWAAVEKTVVAGFDESLDPLIETYQASKVAFDEAEERLDTAKDALKAALGNREKASCQLAKSISFKPNREWDLVAVEKAFPHLPAQYKTKWDLTKLGNDHPELEKDYKKPGAVRPLRVTMREE